MVGLTRAEPLGELKGTTMTSTMLRRYVVLPVVGVALALAGANTAASQASPRDQPFCHDSSYLPRTADAAEHWLSLCRRQSGGAAVDGLHASAPGRRHQPMQCFTAPAGWSASGPANEAGQKVRAIPDALGLEDSASVMDAVLTHVAPALGWR
jgi:hypothetical protein